MVLDRLARVLLILLVISLPFEFRAPAPHLTNLQILFLLVMLASAPAMIRHRGELLSNRVVIAAVAFITVVWIAAVVSGPTAVTIKASARYTAGVGLMCAFLSSGKTRSLRQGWTIAAIAAALYGLLDYIGYGYPALFRSMEFYVGDVRRLSGSFEYANSAAAYYALSLPIVWTTIPTIRSRIAWSALVWTALLLTLSRGAAIAAAGCIILWAVRTRSIRPLGLVAVGGFVFAGLSIYQPGLLIRFSNAPKPAANHNAEYRPQYNQIRERPGKTAEMQIVIRNSGGESWPSAGERRVTVSYHWYDTTAKKIVEIPALETPLPHDVKSNDTVAVTARFRTPDTEGFYLLDWDLRYPVYNWFSVADAVPPSVVEAEIASNVESWRGNGDVSSWYGAKKPPAPAAPEIRRTQL